LCSSVGFVIFKKQNRELPYASERQGKPVSDVLHLADVQIIAANGPAVWLVAVRVAVAWFLPESR
jgi:hypothetical protein